MLYRFLAEESYWVKGISFDLVDNSLSHSVSVGAFIDGAQIGFGRVMIDYFIFGWFANYLVRPTFRGQGVTKKMLVRFGATLVQAPVTQDAQHERCAYALQAIRLQRTRAPTTHTKSRGRIYIPPMIIVILCAYCLSKNVREHFFIARVSLSLSPRGGTLRPRKHSSRSPHISLGYRRSVELHRDAHLHRYVRPYLTSRGK